MCYFNANTWWCREVGPQTNNIITWCTRWMHVLMYPVYRWHLTLTLPYLDMTSPECRVTWQTTWAEDSDNKWHCIPRHCSTALSIVPRQGGILSFASPRRLPGSDRVLHDPALPGPFKIWPDPGICHDFVTLNYMKRRAGIRLATVFDARHCGVKSNRLSTCYFAGDGIMGDGNLPRDGLVSQLTRHYSDVRIDKWSKRDSRLRCFSCSVYCPLASVYVYTTGSHYKLITQSPAGFVANLLCT